MTTPRVGGTAKRRRHSMLRWMLALAVAALGLRMVGMGRGTITAGWQLLRGGDVTMIATVVAIQLGLMVCHAQVLRTSANAVGGILPLPAGLRTSMAAFTLSRTVPGGGAAGGVFATRELVRLGHTPATAMAAMVVSWGIATTMLASVLVAGSLALAAGGNAVALTLPSLGIASLLALAGITGLFALTRPRLRDRVLRILDRPLRWLRQDPVQVAASLQSIGAALRGGRSLVRTAGWAVTAHLLDIATLWLVFAAVGHPIDLATLVLGYTAINFMNTVPEMVPGWIGVFEATVAAVFVGLDVPAEVAFTGVMTYRLLSFWFPTLAGIPPMLQSLALHRRGDGIKWAKDGDIASEIPTDPSADDLSVVSSSPALATPSTNTPKEFAA